MTELELLLMIAAIVGWGTAGFLFGVLSGYRRRVDAAQALLAEVDQADAEELADERECWGAGW